MNAVLFGRRARGRLVLPSIASGTIQSISLNTLANVDPADDPLANPDFPGAPPWESFNDWPSVMDFCGALFMPEVGTAGALMVYGAAGHSAVAACFWVGFDVATQRWARVGNRPLPSDGLEGYELDVTPPATRFDHEWGDWNGSSTDWAEVFRQSGWNPPEGSHTRNMFVRRPPTAAGNASGQIITAWQPTGITAGTGIRGSHVWDADTKLFSRTTNLRPGSGGAVTGMVYDEENDVVIGHNRSSTVTSSELDMLDCSTMEWVRRNASSGIGIAIDSTSFICGGLFVRVNHALSATSPPFTLQAAPIANIVAGTSWAWTTLTLSASSYPVNGSGLSNTVHFERCPEDGNYYAMNRVASDMRLWKLVPPSGDAAAKLAGTWTLDAQTLTGDARIGMAYDYRKLQWCPALTSFLLAPESITDPVQAIRPVGI